MPDAMGRLEFDRRYYGSRTGGVHGILKKLPGDSKGYKSDRMKRNGAWTEVYE